MKNKLILDACCGGRMMWFNKKHPAALYVDIRKESPGFIEDTPNFEIKPDLIADFRSLPFPNGKFNLVVFDPPHIKFRGTKSWAAQKYGSLNEKTWKTDIKKGFDECMRVLADHGTLIFKWSTERDSRSVKVKELIEILKTEPLFGHPTSKSGNTIWICFMKITSKTRSSGGKGK